MGAAFYNININTYYLVKHIHRTKYLSIRDFVKDRLGPIHNCLQIHNTMIEEESSKDLLIKISF